MSVGTPPQPGSVMRYSYLWADENTRGTEEGRKDRPSLVLAVSVQTSEQGFRVLVLAITHSPPASAADAVELPSDEKRRLGLDDAPSWIVTTEGNASLWPGPDVRRIPGRSPPTMFYGQLSRPLLQRVANAYLVNRAAQRARLVMRTD